MTLARINNALVVKNGSLAEDCSCCGGDGWYCCPNGYCPQDVVSSVSVTLQMFDYLVWTKERYSNSLYLHASVGCLGSAYAGTHSLARVSPLTWEKIFPDVPNSSCKASLSFVMTSVYWQVVFSFPILTYGIYAAGNAGQYKELNEMECKGFPDPNAGYPSKPAPLRTASLGGQVGVCGTLSRVGEALGFMTATPVQLDANSLATVLRVDGDNNGTMSILVT